MPKAEVGSTKWLGNKMKAKGLQRLRWYCQVCERQMRDANGFKQHTLSESHVRQMQIVGQDANKYINDYSNDFKNDFLQLLRTSHGEKKININHFYQEYIANKEHVHMNATKWPSLTEFAKFLGREGVCRVEEGDRGLEISWIDSSPEALRRQNAIRKKERQDKGDEDRELRSIKQQVERARRDFESRATTESNPSPIDHPNRLQREDGTKVTMNISRSRQSPRPTSPLSTDLAASVSEAAHGTNDLCDNDHDGDDAVEKVKQYRHMSSQLDQPEPKATATELGKPKISFHSITKAGNVFANAARKSNVMKGPKMIAKSKSSKPMSEAERIMRDELERKRQREEDGHLNLNHKKVRT